MLSFDITGSYTDLYELTMGEVYYLSGRHNDLACFDYFYRKNPYHGGYVIFAGLNDVLDVLQDLHFTAQDITFLKTLNFDAGYIQFLENFRFKGTINSVQEGEVIFPNCPVIQVQGTLFETQLVETLLLNIVNFESLVATKAARIRYVADQRTLSDFGLRRAHGAGSILATRAAIAGGFNSTSNVSAASKYNLPVSGTMAHSFVQGFDTELEAFRCYAQNRPEQCVFLVDTYDTLQSGVPNAITVAKEMESRGEKAWGVRLDSGDLAWLSKAVRKKLNEAGLPHLKIVASNQLDEFVIKSLMEQNAPIDAFGVGTSLVTGQPDAALDGVYKLSMSAGKPRIKLSENPQKSTLPGVKQILRIIDENGQFWGTDALLLQGEDKPATIYHPIDPHKKTNIAAYAQEKLLQQVMLNGHRTTTSPALSDIAAYAAQRLKALPAEYKRFENPHLYKVGISNQLMMLRDELRDNYKTTSI